LGGGGGGKRGTRTRMQKVGGEASKRCPTLKKRKVKIWRLVKARGKSGKKKITQGKGREWGYIVSHQRKNCPILQRRRRRGSVHTLAGRGGEEKKGRFYGEGVLNPK